MVVHARRRLQQADGRQAPEDVRGWTIMRVFHHRAASIRKRAETVALTCQAAHVPSPGSYEKMSTPTWVLLSSITCVTNCLSVRRVPMERRILPPTFLSTHRWRVELHLEKSALKAETIGEGIEARDMHRIACARSNMEACTSSISLSDH